MIAQSSEKNNILLSRFLSKSYHRQTPVDVYIYLFWSLIFNTFNERQERDRERKEKERKTERENKKERDKRENERKNSEREN